ncbi:50S ribosomal protein L15 [Ferrimicrobium sp.]|uniref:50S ribosomal protein L15 n=1 Tax=Ferrimicrobium sp. TaxID=2926050 RepID=UPI00261D8B13|nr:50S ribosomal protein L15 [Ferrimicrobium sp.]
MIYLHDLAPNEGAKTRKRRVGRGIGGKGGKTAGRGTKGQGARDTIPVGFEGGQLPLTQRIPKLRGFDNPFRVSYTVVNLDQLAVLSERGITTISPEVLEATGVIRKGALVKVCARGAVRGAALTVSAHGFSKSARELIESAGGSVSEISLPYKLGRRPSLGNALMNR